MADRRFPDHRRPGQPGPVRVFHTAGQYGLLVARRTEVGSHLFDITGRLTDVPSRYTVQVGPERHVDLPLEGDPHRYFWRFMNHGCRPTAVIRGRRVVALATLEAGQEVTFNYNTTEYDMAEPFACRCDDPQCTGQIRGFRHLSGAARRRLRPWLSAHLIAYLDGRSPEPAGALGRIR